MQLVIVDTDVGFDDARALIMLLKAPNIRVLAITTVFGNVPVKQATANAHRLLTLCDKNDIPVYEGCNDSIVPDERGEHKSSSVHGKDGLGDVPEQWPPYTPVPPCTTPAAVAITQLAQEHPGQVSVLCLGPLTNVAVALSLCPALSTLPHSLYIMGGNSHGIGNVTLAAEANFYCDPEAAKSVLSRMQCPMTIAPWELMSDYGPSSIDRHIDYEPYKTSHAGRIGQFLVSAGNTMRTFLASHNKPLVFIDEVAAAALINEQIIVEHIDKPLSVQLCGQARGQMLVNWLAPATNRIRVIIKYDAELLSCMMLEACTA